MLDEQSKITLHQVATASIKQGLNNGLALTVDAADYATVLQPLQASFVTLRTPGNQLRGCIGSLQARAPLVCDVAHNAFQAAFKDPRFRPLVAAELPSILLHISILNPAKDLQVDSEADLLHQLRPGIDGLILEDGHHHSTFLPAVWETLPTPEEFLQQLKIKATLPANYWSSTIRFFRYTTESF